MRVLPRRGDQAGVLYPGDADMADYLSDLRAGYEEQQPAGVLECELSLSASSHFITDFEVRPKRGRYGNKYADNKSVDVDCQVSVSVTSLGCAGLTGSGSRLLTRLITSRGERELVCDIYDKRQ